MQGRIYVRLPWCDTKQSSAELIPILIGVDGKARSIIEKYNAGLFYEPENELEKTLLNQ